MSNPKNILGQGFHTNPERINRAGYPVGKKNRATVIKELLALKSDDGKDNEYRMMFALLEKACSGDVSAVKEIQDTMYGKIPDKVLTAETEPENLEQDVTENLLKHIPIDVLEAELKKANVTNAVPEGNESV